MMNEKKVHVLSRVATGLRTDSARLKELESELTATLLSARHFGRKHDSPEDWTTDWDQQWDNLEGILRRMRALIQELEHAIESHHNDHHEKAMRLWDSFQAEDAALLGSLAGLRAQAGLLKAVVRPDWNMLARVIESHLGTIHACGQALRVKLELHRKHSKEEVKAAVQKLLSKLPHWTHSALLDSDYSEEEYLRAANDLEHEQHAFLGFMDVGKALLMWVDTTEERVLKNRSLQLEEV